MFRQCTQDQHPFETAVGATHTNVSFSVYSIIAVVGISVPLLYLWQSQNTSAQKHSLPDNYTAPAAPSTDPAASVRATKDEAKARDGKAKYEHPEDREPEKFKPAFGRVHERKRVDGAPHGRNHQELMDRQRQE